jgi:hypothetical protein
MKKIGTLTFQNADNYGAILQCYALHKTLANMGVENDVINYQGDYMAKSYSLAALKRKGVIRFFLGIAYSIVRMPRKARFAELRTHIKMTPKLNMRDLISLEEQYDGFIVGSDQVWNDSITDFDPSYFLDFVKSPKKKLSYAASFGFEGIPNDLKIKYKDLLNDFCVYNMREASGVEIIDSLLNKPANLVLDPTFLLTRNEWDTIACTPDQKEKYILVYQVTLSSFLIKTVKKIVKSTGYKVVAIPFPLGSFIKAKVKLSAGPREWIGLIRDAEIVVTDSFHGSVFSILYKKKFYVCITNAPTRIYNLLNVFQLNGCLYKPGSKLELTKKIDWKKTNFILHEERKRSINFILDMLKLKC